MRSGGRSFRGLPPNIFSGEIRQVHGIDFTTDWAARGSRLEQLLVYRKAPWCRWPPHRRIRENQALPSDRCPAIMGDIRFQRFAGGAPCELNTNTSNSTAFEVGSKRRKGFPSETHVQRGERVVAAAKNSLRNSAARIRARAVPAVDFKRCCMLTGQFDGSNRDYFFR
jgi:hypothetical protein